MTSNIKGLTLLFIVLSLLSISFNLSIGTVNQNNLQSFPMEIDGSITNSKLVIDGNWHWIHSQQDMNRNCYPSTQWNTDVCPDPDTCWRVCAVEGVPNEQWSGNYGVHVQGDKVTLDYVTRHQYGTNVGSRMYFTEPTGNRYIGFNMLGR
jgi:cellulose 1,4-beta-cellobiosidase